MKTPGTATENLLSRRLHFGARILSRYAWIFLCLNFQNPHLSPIINVRLDRFFRAQSNRDCLVLAVNWCKFYICLFSWPEIWVIGRICVFFHWFSSFCLSVCIVWWMFFPQSRDYYVVILLWFPRQFKGTTVVWIILPVQGVDPLV